MIILKIMRNPLLACNVDDGVNFIQFLREQCVPEIEKLTQSDLNIISAIVRTHTDRKFFTPARENPLDQLKKLPEPTPKKKKAPAKKKK